MSERGSIYDKHRHIIHNQTLIVALAIFSNFLSFPIIPAIILYLYSSIPQIFVPVVLIGWGILLVFTASIDCYIAYQKWKERHSYEEETDFNQRSRRKEEKHASDNVIY